MKLAAIEAIAAGFADADVRYLVVGGLAVAAPVRAEEFYDAATRDSWVREKGMVVFQMISTIHRDTPVDVFVTEPFDFDAEHGQALVAPLAPGVELRCASIDTLIRMKRLAGRPKDLEDIRQLELLKAGPRRG